MCSPSDAPGCLCHHSRCLSDGEIGLRRLLGVVSYVLTELVAFNDFELVRVISSVFSGNSRT